MAGNGHQLCSFLSRNQVLEKMMKEIDQISEVFAVSKSDASVALIRLKWNMFQASDRLGDDKEKFLSDSGLVRVFDLNQSNSMSLCADKEAHAHGEDGVSTPFCSHRFCTAYWKDYLKKMLEEKKDGERVLLCCPHQDCVASVGPDTIEKFDETVKEMYESYIVGSFMEGKKDSIKWCPGPGCGYAIAIGDDVGVEDEPNGFAVVCLCGHISCWNCQLESHRPVSCKNASLWWNQLLDQSRSVAWIDENTKRCPDCHNAVERDGDPDLRMITCRCGFKFCWRCFRSEREHNGRWNCVDKVVSLFTKKHNLILWDAAQEALETAKLELKFIEETSIPNFMQTFGLSEQDKRALREAWMLVVQCRLILKWMSIFDYFTSEGQTGKKQYSGKKQYLNNLMDEARKTLFRHREVVIEVMSQSISSGDLSGFIFKVPDSTTSTGDFFHKIVKSLEDGMPEAMVDAYENAPTSYWICDRCTAQNIWSETDCKICHAPHASPIPQDVGNNSASVKWRRST